MLCGSESAAFSLPARSAKGKKDLLWAADKSRFLTENATCVGVNHRTETVLLLFNFFVNSFKSLGLLMNRCPSPQKGNVELIVICLLSIFCQTVLNDMCRCVLVYGLELMHLQKKGTVHTNVIETNVFISLCLC